MNTDAYRPLDNSYSVNSMLSKKPDA